MNDSATFVNDVSVMAQQQQLEAAAECPFVDFLNVHSFTDYSAGTSELDLTRLGFPSNDELQFNQMLCGLQSANDATAKNDASSNDTPAIVAQAAKPKRNPPELKKATHETSVPHLESIEIDLHRYVSQRKSPTSENIGEAVASALGFRQNEMYAYSHGKEPGASFYKAHTNNDGQVFLRIASGDAAKGRVLIKELEQGAFQEKRQWLNRYRAEHSPQNPILSYDWAKERSLFDAIVTNIAVPVSAAAGSTADTVGDMVRGLGLPLHLVANRTFMDHFADYLKNKGESMDLSGLYTEGDLDNALVLIANVYAHAAGNSLPYMLPNAIASGAGRMAGSLSEAATSLTVSARTVRIAAEIMGGTQSAGRVYENALTMQARQIAQGEMGKDATKDGLNKRVHEIIDGVNIDPDVRQKIENKAVIAGLIAGPAGVVQGRWLGALSRQIIGGTPVFSNLIANIKDHMIAGAIFSTAKTTLSEAGYAVSGVKSWQAASHDLGKELPKAATQGALVGLSGALLAGAHELTRSSPPIDDTGRNEGEAVTETGLPVTQVPGDIATTASGGPPNENPAFDETTPQVIAEGEPPLAPGEMRLYTVESVRPLGQFEAARYEKVSQKILDGTADDNDREFLFDAVRRTEISYFDNPAGARAAGEKGRVSYIDVPMDLADRYRARSYRYIEGQGYVPEPWEYYVPSDIHEGAQELPLPKKPDAPANSEQE